MDSHDVRDPDGVIDEVARAMTSAELGRDLRPAVASRLASPAPWTLFGQPWWRAGLATAAVAAAVLAVVVPRPDTEPQRRQPVAVAGDTRSVPAQRPGPAAVEATSGDERQQIASRPRMRPVARQTIDDTDIAEIVAISPVAIVPLEGDDEDTVLTSSHVVEIAPIDVEPVRISGLELVE
jgi:hypothetical protein